MPKIVDHDEYRSHLAKQASLLFSKYGYSGLGMRKIAQELGISKSALYHYFPTKRDLFLASTDSITKGETEALTAKSESQSVDDVILEIMQGMETGFASEMSLLFDYLRGWDADAIAVDPSMKLANERYLAMLDGLVPEQMKKPVLAYMIGVLLFRHLDGKQTDLAEFKQAIKVMIAV